MHSKMIGVTFLVLMLIAPVLAAEDEPNLCFTTQAGQCETDNDWQVGWFWANHPPGNSSCDLYEQRFGYDGWGMCDEINQDDDSDDGEWSEAEADLFFKLTSDWHAMPEDESTACPWDGLNPIINYEDNTFVCASSF